MQAARCHEEAGRQLLFTWASVDAHPNSTELSATGAASLNIANYHACRRYDYTFGAGDPVGAGDTHGAPGERGGGGGAPGAGGFADFFTDYFDGRLEPAYLCPPRVDPIDWTVAAVYFLSFAAVIEALLAQLESRGATKGGGGGQEVPTPSRSGAPQAGGGAGGGPAKGAADAAEAAPPPLRFRGPRAGLGGVKVCTPCPPTPTPTPTPTPPRRALAGSLGRLGLAAVGGAAVMVGLWVYDSALVSCPDTAALVLAAAVRRRDEPCQPFAPPPTTMHTHTPHVLSWFVRGVANIVAVEAHDRRAGLEGSSARPHHASSIHG